MKSLNSVAWSVNMPERQMGDLENRLLSLHGTAEQLTAPLLKFDSIMRPSLHGALNKTVSVDAQVTVEHYSRKCSVIGLQFPKSVAEYIGRPIMGYSEENTHTSYFGDADGVDAGLIRTEVIAHPDGNAVMVGHFLDNSPRVLTGLANEEVTGFIVGCLSAVEKHRSKIQKKN